MAQDIHHVNYLTQEAMNTLKFKLNADYSGCAYTLYADDVFVKTWGITYGWNTPEWQEKEKQGRADMQAELADMGLDFDELNQPETVDRECKECDGLGYTYEGGMSMNEEMNIRVPCTTCDSDGYEQLDDRLKR